MLDGCTLNRYTIVMTTIFYSNARSLELARIDNVRTGAWVHVVAPTEEELKAIAKKYKLDEDLLTDAIDLYESPRIERSDNAVFVFTRYFHPDNGVINATEPLLIVYAPDFLLTIVRTDSAVLQPLTEGREQVITTQKTKTLLLMLEAVNESYSRYLTRATKQILQVRSQLRRTDISSEVLLNFVGLEDDLNEFISALQPQAAMLRSLLSSKYIRLYEEDKDLIEDLSLGTAELLDLVKSRLKTIISIREAYDAIAANELNKTFRRLTSISIFLMIPTIIFSLYGMNIDLPLDNNVHAFWYVMIAVLVTNVAVIYVFKRKRWV